jgi:hypothetical protein
MARFFRVSRARRSRSCRLVKNFESLHLPANGDVLTPIRILMVGCSTWMRGSARVLPARVEVDDRVADVDVLDAGDGDDLARRRLCDRRALQPLERREHLDGPLSDAPSLMMPTGWLARTVPATTRPIAERPV